jgi:hypothetical protein
VQILNLKIHESAFSRSRVVLYGKAGRQTNYEANIAFLQLFCEQHKNKTLRKMVFYELMGQLL